MTAENHLGDGNRQKGSYQVRVKGCLSADFLTWLELTGEYDPQLDETCLWIAPPDQAALYGLLNRLRDLGLTLIFVEGQHDDTRNSNSAIPKGT